MVDLNRYVLSLEQLKFKFNLFHNLYCDWAFGDRGMINSGMGLGFFYYHPNLPLPIAPNPHTTL